MNTTLNGLRTAILILVSTSMLTGCGAFSTIRDAVLPDFSDEELENPMASFVPARGTNCSIWLANTLSFVTRTDSPWFGHSSIVT
ncbi:MAG: hypothetical protein ACPG42_10850, partial [Alphaproteobacteria bacterium]